MVIFDDDEIDFETTNWRIVVDDHADEAGFEHKPTGNALTFDGEGNLTLPSDAEISSADIQELTATLAGTLDADGNDISNVGGFSAEQIPTVSGAKIVESGSNDDGEWIRWADGTQIVTIKDLTTDEYEEQADLIDDFVVIEDIYYPRQFDSLHYLDGWAKHDVGTSNLDRHTPLNLRFGRFGSDEYSNTARINRLIIYGPQGDDRWPDRNDTDQIHYSILAIGTWDDTS